MKKGEKKKELSRGDKESSNRKTIDKYNDGFVLFLFGHCIRIVLKIETSIFCVLDSEVRLTRPAL